MPTSGTIASRPLSTGLVVIDRYAGGPARASKAQEEDARIGQYPAGYKQQHVDADKRRDAENNHSKDNRGHAVDRSTQSGLGQCTVKDIKTDVHNIRWRAHSTKSASLAANLFNEAMNEVEKAGPLIQEPPKKLVKMVNRINSAKNLPI